MTSATGGRMGHAYIADKKDRFANPWVETVRGGVIALLLLSASLHVWLVLSFWAFTVDDTFITLRYARNLAQGAGLTWNPGETPTEGYTSFAWTLLLALGHGLTDHAEVLSKGASLVSTLIAWTLTLLCAWNLLNEDEKRHGSLRLDLRLEILAFVASWPLVHLDSAVHAVSGMDTALFTAVLVACSFALLRVASRPTKLACVSFALSGLALGLTRPEGVVFFAIAAGGLLLTLDGASRRILVKCVFFFFILPGAAYFAWRLAHFGLFFPLPFYVKAVGNGAALAGAEEARVFLLDTFAWSPALAALALFGIADGPRRFWPLAGAAVVLFLFFLFPAPLMAYNHRYLQPLLPIVTLAAALGLIAMVRRLQRRHWSTSKIALVACALPLTAIGGTALRGYTALETNLDDKLSYARGLNHAHRAIGEALEQMETTPAKRRVALLDVGSIGYHAPSWSVLDTFGLTNAEVALQGRGEPGYILAEQPSFIVFVSSHAKRLDLVFDHERPLLEASRQAGYRWKESLEFQPRYYLALFEYTPPPLGSSKIREEEAHQN